MHLVQTLMGVSLAVVAAVLLTGVVAFAKGGPWYHRHANQLMNLRVAAQLTAVLIFALSVWLAG